MSAAVACLKGMTAEFIFFLASDHELEDVNDLAWYFIKSAENRWIFGAYERNLTDGVGQFKEVTIDISPLSF